MSARIVVRTIVRKTVRAVPYAAAGIVLAVACSWGSPANADTPVPTPGISIQTTTVPVAPSKPVRTATPLPPAQVAENCAATGEGDCGTVVTTTTQPPIPYSAPSGLAHTGSNIFGDYVAGIVALFAVLVGALLVILRSNWKYWRIRRQTAVEMQPREIGIIDQNEDNS